jgi:hypothetical protein
MSGRSIAKSSRKTSPASPNATSSPAAASGPSASAAPAGLTTDLFGPDPAPADPSAKPASKGFDDPRHLWPEWFRLIRERRPGVLFGEQSDEADAWLDLVSTDLEGVGYAIGSVDCTGCGLRGATTPALWVRGRRRQRRVVVRACPLARRQLAEDRTGPRRPSRWRWWRSWLAWATPTRRRTPERWRSDGRRRAQRQPERPASALLGIRRSGGVGDAQQRDYRTPNLESFADRGRGP